MFRHFKQYIVFSVYCVPRIEKGGDSLDMINLRNTDSPGRPKFENENILCDLILSFCRFRSIFGSLFSNSTRMDNPVDDGSGDGGKMKMEGMEDDEEDDEPGPSNRYGPY